MADDAFGWIKHAVESGMRVKLAPGVVGKSAMMWAGVIIAWIVAIFRLNPTASISFNGLPFLATTFLTFVVMRETGKMREYAEKNPGVALLEGAELTEYRRVEAQAKGIAGPDKSSPTAGPTAIGVRSGQSEGLQP